MNTQRKKLIATMIIGMLFGAIIGYSIGFGMAVKAIADVAGNFIDIDYQEVADALTKYRGHIGGCYNDQDEWMENNYSSNSSINSD